MDFKSIITKVQFNIADDPDIYEILTQTSKRKRAYTLRKMLTEYIQIRKVLLARRSKKTIEPVRINKQVEINKQIRENHDDMTYLLSSIYS